MDGRCKRIRMYAFTDDGALEDPFKNAERILECQLTKNMFGANDIEIILHGKIVSLLGYDLNTLRKEARRLKQSLIDNHVNTHFIDQSNIKIISRMLEVLVVEKRRRLIDYILQQEEFVKCNWDREYEKYKQIQLESNNRRDSGLGNR